MKRPDRLRLSELWRSFLSEVGCLHGDLIVSSHQEPAIASLVNEIGRPRQAQDQVRETRVSLQDRWKVDASHVRGGSTSHGQREAEGVEGEALADGVRRIGSMVKPPGREWCSWEAGLGVEPRCGKTVEIAIGARSGIFKARTVRRRSTEDRWAHRSTVEDERGRRQGRRGAVREVAGT